MNHKVFDAYDHLTQFQIEKIYDNAHVRYFASYSKYDNLVVAKQNQNYYIYDLKKTFEKK